MRVSVEAEPISHLFFVDDSVVFCQANEYEANQVMRILQDYGDSSGHIINSDKSSIFFGKGCPKKTKKTHRYGDEYSSKRRIR